MLQLFIQGFKNSLSSSRNTTTVREEANEISAHILHIYACTQITVRTKLPNKKTGEINEEIRCLCVYYNNLNTTSVAR